MSFNEKIFDIIAKERVLINEPMKEHTTFRVGGPADYYVMPKETELLAVIQCAKEEGLPVTVIGAGSNLLVRDGGIRGVVVEIGREMSDISVAEENGKIVIDAGAGVRLTTLAQSAAAHAGAGLAFASGIPGNVGGAVAMNAGAYGGEIKDVIVSATVLSEDGMLLTLTNEELDLSYRHSCIFEKNYIVVSAKFALEPGDEAAIRAEMADYAKRRIDKQPLEFPSAGSTFKRPEGYFAGKLIEDANLKGFSVGGAQVSEKHSGFVINRGDATASDILELIEAVSNKVYETFGVTLETEVRILGVDKA